MTFFKNVSTVLLLSEVLMYTKYKVEFKVYNKLLIGQNKQWKLNNVCNYKESFKLT